MWLKITALGKHDQNILFLAQANVTFKAFMIKNTIVIGLLDCVK